MPHKYSNRGIFPFGKIRGAQIPKATSPWRLYFVQWRLVLVGPQYGTLLLVMLLAPRRLKSHLDFWKICAPLGKAAGVWNYSHSPLSLLERLSCINRAIACLNSTIRLHGVVLNEARKQRSLATCHTRLWHISELILLVLIVIYCDVMLLMSHVVHLLMTTWGAEVSFPAVTRFFERFVSSGWTAWFWRQKHCATPKHRQLFTSWHAATSTRM
jgi:hypothetical protein